jgi:hypothetical protein
MVKLYCAVALLFVFALIAIAYLNVNPILTFVLASVGLYLFARSGGGSLWPQSIVQWGAGRGIYLRGDDRWVEGSDPNDTADREGPDPEHR